MILNLCSNFFQKKYLVTMDKLKEKKSIDSVVSTSLCNGCGACFAVCKPEAIKLVETISGRIEPLVNREKCINCGACLKVCPGRGFNVDLFGDRIKDPFVGNAVASYTGFATNKNVYNNSQSGGIVSALLMNALDNKKIAGAVVAGQIYGNPPRPFPFVAHKTDEIINAQKSKYVPIPTLSVLKEISNNPYPVALVGLPCHIHGIENILSRYPKIKECIKFKIGLICDRVLSFSAVDYLISQSLDRKDQSLEFIFRDKARTGYPGDISIRLENEDPIFLSAKKRIEIKDIFTPPRCRVCFDKMNIFSDITVGDPHGIQNIEQLNGESSIVVRTEQGKELVNFAMEKKDVILNQLAYSNIIKGQRIDLKKMYWRGYTEEWKKFKKPLPNYFEYVKKFTCYKNQQKYRKDLNLAFSLEQFTDKKTLLKHANQIMESVYFRTKVKSRIKKLIPWKKKKR